MTERDDGGPAFPVHGGHPGDDPRNQILGGGLTIRDWFAGQALAGLLAQPRLTATDAQSVSKHAYEIADAMLAARALTQEQKP